VVVPTATADIGIAIGSGADVAKEDSLGVPIAALGWLNPMIAGAAMALSSLAVILNSALLRRYRRAVAGHVLA